MNGTISPPPAHDPRPSQDEVRRNIRRAAWALALVAIAIYVGFIASGILQGRP